MQEAVRLHQPTQTTFQYLADPQLWFEFIPELAIRVPLDRCACRPFNLPALQGIAGVRNPFRHKTAKRAPEAIGAILWLFSGTGRSANCSFRSSYSNREDLAMAAKSEKTLQDLFHDTLRDIFYAERKVLKALPKMARAAKSADLKAGLRKASARRRKFMLNASSRSSSCWASGLRARPAPASRASSKKAKR